MDEKTIGKVGIYATLKGVLGTYWASGVVNYDWEFSFKLLPKTVQEVFSLPLYPVEAILYPIRAVGGVYHAAKGAIFLDGTEFMKAIDTFTTFRVLHNEHLGPYLDQLLPESTTRFLNENNLTLTLPIIGIGLICSAMRSYRDRCNEEAFPISNTPTFRVPKKKVKSLEHIVAK